MQYFSCGRSNSKQGANQTIFRSSGGAFQCSPPLALTKKNRPLQLPVEGAHLEPLLSAGGYRRRRPKSPENSRRYAPPTTIVMVRHLILRQFICNIPSKRSFRNNRILAWTTPRRGNLRGVKFPDPTTWKTDPNKNQH